jgi:hypothetical protein
MLLISQITPVSLLVRMLVVACLSWITSTTVLSLALTATSTEEDNPLLSLPQ